MSDHDVQNMEASVRAEEKCRGAEQRDERGDRGRATDSEGAAAAHREVGTVC